MMDFLQNLKPSQELVNWALFNVALPIFPIAIVFVIGWVVGKFQNLFTIIRGGQLCFYCTAISASLMKDMIGKPEFTASVCGGLIVLIMLSMGFYGAAVATQPTRDDTKKFGWASIFLWVVVVTLVLFARNKLRLL
jgi:hypothetical protein